MTSSDDSIKGYYCILICLHFMILVDSIMTKIALQHVYFHLRGTVICKLRHIILEIFGLLFLLLHVLELNL